MFIFCFTLLPKDKADDNPKKNGTTTQPKPIIDIVTETVIRAITTTASTDFNTDVMAVKFSYFFSF